MVTSDVNPLEGSGFETQQSRMVFDTAPAGVTTNSMMFELIDWYNNNIQLSAWPIAVIIEFIYRFLAIHPFQDGNGRLSRVLATLLLLKANYRYVPYSSLESIIEKSKDSYYLALRRTQGTLDDEQPKWEPWLSFFLNALKKQKNHLVAKIESDNGWDGLPLESIKILEYLNKNQRITRKVAEEMMTIPRTTLTLRFNELVDQGFIVRYGKARATWYGLKK